MNSFGPAGPLPIAKKKNQTGAIMASTAPKSGTSFIFLTLKHLARSYTKISKKNA